MAIPIRFSRGMMKPPMGAMINTEHPFSRGLSFVIPFNDAGCGPRSLVNYPQWPASVLAIGGPCSNASAAYGGPSNNVLWGVNASTNSPYWTSNSEGSCLSFPATVGYGIIAGNAVQQSPITMTDRVTVAFIQRKLDTTVRNNRFLHHGAEGTYLGIITRWSDGNCYFYFGTNAGVFTVPAADYPAATTNIERWVFTNGPSGVTVFLNGVKIASSSTQRTRSVNLGTPLYLSNDSAANLSDLREINWIQISDTQWSDQECQWWSAEPYAHLYSEVSDRSYFFLGNGALGSVESTSLWLVG